MDDLIITVFVMGDYDVEEDNGVYAIYDKDGFQVAEARLEVTDMRYMAEA